MPALTLGVTIQIGPDDFAHFLEVKRFAHPAPGAGFARPLAALPDALHFDFQRVQARPPAGAVLRDHLGHGAEFRLHAAQPASNTAVNGQRTRQRCQADDGTTFVERRREFQRHADYRRTRQS